jgi:hypothetical protein
MDRYFGEDSIYELNLPSTTKQETIESASKEITPDLFRKAQIVIFQTMELDSWRGYLKSQLYESYCEEKKGFYSLYLSN